VACAHPAHRALLRWGDAGIVIVDFANGPSVFVYVSAEAGGAVAASSPAPYPSGY
jgi:hypothetical protein